MALRAAILCALTAVSAACAADSYQRVPVPPQDVEVSSSAVSRIYVLRPGEAKGFNRYVLVEEDTHEVGKVGNAGYLCWERSPGRFLLTLTVEPVELADGKPQQLFMDVKCEAGETYYYAVNVNSSWGSGELREVDRSEARMLLEDLSLPDPD
jgi:hypothetical protein